MSDMPRPQPYSMAAFFGYRPELMAFAMPSTSTMRPLPEVAILTCLIAPLAVQREARAAGVTSLIMIEPKGLREAMAKHTNKDAQDPDGYPVGNKDNAKRGRGKEAENLTKNEHKPKHEKGDGR